MRHPPFGGCRVNFPPFRKVQKSVIDDYLAEHSGRHLELMQQLRELVRTLAPEATERLSWGMPTFHLNGNLVHFAAGKNHVGFYPGADGVGLVVDELDRRGLKHSKGTIQLKLAEPLPVELITRIVEFRLEQQRAKQK